MGKPCRQNERGQGCFQNINGYTYMKETFRRNRCRWVDTIRMYLRETGINTWNWVGLAQDRDYWRALVNPTLTSGLHKP